MTQAVPTVHERMSAILAELPPIGKDQRNEQQRFMFRGHDDVMNALNPLLAKHGVFVLPTVLGRETSQRTTAKGSLMFEVSLLVEYTFYGLAGDSVRASAWGEGTDMGDKATSKAMTMAFKSVLNQAFAISNKENADPDGNTVEESSASTVQAAGQAQAAQPSSSSLPSSTISEPQRKRLFAIAKSKNVDDDTVKRLVLEVAGVESSSAVPKAKYDALVAAVEMAAVMEGAPAGGTLDEKDVPFAPTMDGLV